MQGLEGRLPGESPFGRRGSRAASPLLPVEPTEPSEKGADDADPTAEAHRRSNQNELVAEGNVVAAATIFAASVVLDALNALPTTLVVDVPVSLRTTSLVLVALVASPAVRPEVRFHQRTASYALLAIAAWSGLHQGGVNARIADALYTLLCGWAVIVIYGLTGPGVGKRGHDSNGRRENVIALAASFLGYSGMRIVRAGFTHASHVVQFTSTHDDITTRGFGMANDLVASTLVFGGILCVCASIIVLSNHEAIYTHGCSPICAVMGHLSVLVFTSAFVVQVVTFAKIDDLGVIFGDHACVGSLQMCSASFRARRLYTSNSSAAPLWCCAVGLVAFAFPYNRRCRSRREYFVSTEEGVGEDGGGAREAATGSGYVAVFSSVVAVAIVLIHGDRENLVPSVELLLLYASIPLAWFGNAATSCALHGAGIAMYTAGRLGSVWGFDLSYLTHWFVGCTLVVVTALTLTTFVSWALYASWCSRGKYVVWLDNLTALLLVALVGTQLFLVVASLAIGSGYDGSFIANAPSWRISSIQWCTQHSITFFFAAALVGGRFEPHNDQISRRTLRATWFATPLLLVSCWFVYLLLNSATIPYGASGDALSLGVAFAAAAAPWAVSGAVIC
tara:strand:- start:307 stop:2166 length:1860 start_codon:yes stop_codon:yes gene_type:complete